MNEVVVLISVWLLCLMTDYVPSPELRYEFGEDLILMVKGVFAVNVAILVHSIIEKVYKAVRQYCTERRYKKAMENKVSQKQDPSQMMEEEEKEGVVVVDDSLQMQMIHRRQLMLV